MITTRLLPPEEWDRLRETDLAPVTDLLLVKSEATDVVVAENEDGEIVGHVAFCLFRHAEGFGIAPEERKHGRVMRALLDAMRDYCETREVTGVWSGSLTEEMTGYLLRRGATEIPGAHLVWSPAEKPTIIREDSPCLFPS